VFVSQALLDELCGASRRLAAGSCSVVHDGLPMPAIPNEADRRAARGTLQLSQDKLLVLFAGQMIERKGVADLLNAWRLVRAKWADRAELVLVGDDLENDGSYRKQMESLARQLECGARFVGFQRNVPQWLAAADVCVVPSHAEPLGNATLEAMAHARPVIGCHVGGIPEMVDEGVTGLLVPPHDPTKLAEAISRLLQDENLRRRLGAAARGRCEERFSLKAHVDAVVAQYGLALKRREPATA
jgi:glycosyltransferase involved in cell wall biosynthesis